MIHKMHEFWLSLLLRFPKSNESLDSQLNAENAACLHYTVSASFSLQTVHAGKFPPLKPGTQGRELQKSSSCLFAYICLYASSFSNTQLSLIFHYPALADFAAATGLSTKKNSPSRKTFMQLIARGFCKKLEKFERSFQRMFSISVRASRWNDPLEKIRHFGNFEVPVPTLPSRTTMSLTMSPSMYKPLQK